MKEVAIKGGLNDGSELERDDFGGLSRGRP
jgi:hypothetical protein